MAKAIVSTETGKELDGGKVREAPKPLAGIVGS
jgi:hypothetical protein